MTHAHKLATTMTTREHMALELHKALIMSRAHGETAEYADLSVFLAEELLHALHTPPELRDLEDDA